MRLRFVLFVSLIYASLVPDVLIAQSFSTGGIGILTSNYGRVRVHADSTTGVRQIDRSSFLAAIDTDYVFSYLLSSELVDTFKNVVNPVISDFEIYGAIDGSYDTTGQSPDFLVKHNIYGWTGGAYALVKFTVINREASPQAPTLGMEIISQIDGTYGLETVYWIPDNKITAQYRPPTSTYIGYKLLSGETTTARFIEWYDGYNESNNELYTWLTASVFDSPLESGGDGAVAFFSQSPVNIAAGDSAVMWVAIALGSDEAGMIRSMTLAEGRYSSITDVEDKISAVPSDYNLSQNYPNPFNPSTTISFSIPKNEYVNIKVYDLLGNEIAVLADGQMTAGNHSVVFNSKSLPSGIYFYQLTTGDFSETRKMNLLK